MMQQFNQNIADPRCPLCGRAVIGEKVVGMEGSYHPECTKPAPPVVPPSPFYPWGSGDCPGVIPPYQPTIICMEIPEWRGNFCLPSAPR